MENIKSQDEFEIIAALLCDVQKSHSGVFTPRALKLTLRKLRKRFDSEGMSLLTKTLPRLGRAFDKALAGNTFVAEGWSLLPDSVLPVFLGELFKCVLANDGTALSAPCVKSIKSIRQILFPFGKYKLPFDPNQEQEVLDLFERTDHELEGYNNVCTSNSTCAASSPRCTECTSSFTGGGHNVPWRIVKEARRLLKELFEHFDERDIYPRHGPGSVSTKEKGPGKWHWTNIPARITQTYPLDEYFYTSLGHVCDSFQEIQSLSEAESFAKVILVPKDSRGPRLISEEPLAFQWIQQGLHRAIVAHVESHPLTRCHVHFTDQTPNQRGALLGSMARLGYSHTAKKAYTFYTVDKGQYATLDLKEASDRISIGLVRLLFPENITNALMNCRSLETRMPSGKNIKLNKFAPMGSALCFPVLAISIWAILAAGFDDADARESILVFGDDVIVQTAQAENAIKLLESFGLKVNRDKSCYHGFFRESCGVDAYMGVDVTPVRFRTVWSHRRRYEVYEAWIAYANALHQRSYFSTYDLIVKRLHAIYGELPSVDMHLACPSLVEVPEEMRPKRRRFGRDFHLLQYRVWTPKSPRLSKEVNGWMMLLRYFCESIGRPKPQPENVPADADLLSFLEKYFPVRKFSVVSYTERDTSYLAKDWVDVEKTETYVPSEVTLAWRKRLLQSWSQ